MGIWCVYTHGHTHTHAQLAQAVRASLPHVPPVPSNPYALDSGGRIRVPCGTLILSLSHTHSLTHVFFPAKGGNLLKGKTVLTLLYSHLPNLSSSLFLFHRDSRKPPLLLSSFCLSFKRLSQSYDYSYERVACNRLILQHITIINLDKI